MDCKVKEPGLIPGRDTEKNNYISEEQ